MDEFDFDLLLKEISDSIGDAEKLKDYITGKYEAFIWYHLFGLTRGLLSTHSSDRSIVLVERFLVSLASS